VAINKKIHKVLKPVVILLMVILSYSFGVHAFAATSQSGSVGIEGTVPGPPPSRAATIDIPKNGQSFSTLPITVAGTCPPNTLVEIYKNNVFAGATDCVRGSYTLQIDLFEGRNDLVAKVFDNLNQAGPVSATVTVTFSSKVATGGSRLILTTQFAKRGADPGSILNWPITISGGTPPYAISVDWGDNTTLDLISRKIPGNLNISHTYKQAGIYKVTIKASDANGNAAFLQLVAIANGPIKQTNAGGSDNALSIQTKVLLWPILVLFCLMIAAFFIGKRHQLEAIQNRLRRGEPPF
jgi:hypothetical protein